MNKISIIVANYNKADFIQEMIVSVINQSYSCFELIIVDDCSSDNSREILERYSNQDKRINVEFLNENKGGGFARNTGLEKATGDYIIFLDSDDILHKDCLLNRNNFIKSYEDFDLWVFSMGVFKNTIGDQPISSYWFPKTSNYLEQFLMHRLPWAICQPIWDANFLKKIGGFDSDFTRLQDVELHTRALLKGARVKLDSSKNVDCYYRISDERFRKNYEPFMKAFSIGVAQYHSKFFKELDNKKQKKLGITILELLSIFCYHLKNNNISKKFFEAESKKIIHISKFAYQRMILKIYLFFNTKLLFHIKGLKKGFSYLMVI